MRYNCIVIMSNKDRADQIKSLLKTQHRSVAWLAKELKISRQAVTLWLAQKSNPRDPQVFDRMLKALGEPELDRPRIPVGFPKGRIPFAGEVPCSADWGEPLASEEFIEVEVQFEHPQRFAAKVVGDSCYPALHPGDVTIWHADMSPPFGLIVLAQRKGDHGCTVKRLEYDQDRGRPLLVPVNPAHKKPEDGEGWGVIARLVGVLRTTDGLKKSWYLDSGLRQAHLQ